MVVGVEIKNAVKKKVPEQGYYVKMNWMYGDADGYEKTKVGPIPKGREDILIEFLNVLHDMERLYPNGKGGWDDYEGQIVDYDKYFDEYYDLGDDATQKEKEDQEIRESLGAEIEYTPDDSGCVASFEGFEVFYHDGITFDKYKVDIKMDGIEREFLDDDENYDDDDY